MLPSNYSFNGKEKDDEVYGEGNFQDYGMRCYDNRLGRFFKVDPITTDYPELTPYQFASNRPIDGLDLDGLEYFNGTSRVGFSLNNNFTTTNNYIRIDRQKYQVTRNAMSDFKLIAVGFNLDNKVYESDLSWYKLKAVDKKYDWDKFAGKGQIANPKLIPNGPNSTIFQKGVYGLGGLLVIALDNLDKLNKQKLSNDMGITAAHNEKLLETWKLVNTAIDKGLVPEGFDKIEVKIDLANFILDSALPEGKDEEYVKKIQTLGKQLFDNRMEILKVETVVGPPTTATTYVGTTPHPTNEETKPKDEPVKPATKKPQQTSKD